MNIVRGKWKRITLHDKQTLFCLALISLSCVGCLDFVEPAAPAPDSTRARIFLSAYQGTDGRTSIDGGFAPGIDANGEHRTISREAVIAFGVTIPPTVMREDSIRIYKHQMTVVDSARGIFTVDPPAVNGLASRPVVRWFGFRKISPDTIRLERGADLVLDIEMSLGTSQPMPDSRDWFLFLGADPQRFSMGGTGPPPATIRVPAQYLQVSADSVMLAILSFNQHGTVVVPHYEADYSYYAQSSWTVIVR
jgi:hypothetical protein